MTQNKLLEILEDLTENEFTKFKYFLNDAEIMEGFNTIKRYQLETNERMVVMELMVKANNVQGAMEITQKILEKIPRNDILQNLSAVISGPAGC